VFDTATEEHLDVNICVGGGKLCNLTERVETLGELTDDDSGPGEELWSHGEVPEAVGQLDPNRIVRQRLLAGDGVLMHSNVLGTVQRNRAERHGAVSVSDDDNSAGVRCLDVSASLGQDEAIGRVDGHEVVGFEVGKPTQDLEVEGVPH
jgi:hypothetical protein